METAIQAIDPAEFIKQGNDFVSTARRMQVTTNEEYEAAGRFVQSTKTIQTGVEAKLGVGVQQAHQLHKHLVGQMKAAVEPYDTSIKIVKGLMSQYTMQKERERVAEENRLRELARKQEEERRLAEAIELEAAGQKEAAEEVVAAPVRTPVVVVQSTVPKVAGISTRKNWKFRIVDASKIPFAYMMPDEKKIGAMARSMQDQASLPGVEFFSEDVVAAHGF